MDLVQLAGAAGVGALVSVIGQWFHGWRERSQREKQDQRAHERAKMELAARLIDAHMERAREAANRGVPYQMQAPPMLLLKYLKAIDEIETSRTWKRGDELAAKHEKQKALLDAAGEDE